MHEDHVRGYKTTDGTYIVFLESCPTIVGKGSTAAEALKDLVEIYRAIMKAVGNITSE